MWSSSKKNLNAFWLTSTVYKIDSSEKNENDNFKLFSAQVRFASVDRDFEPLDEGLETSDVESKCPEGMMAEGEICG